MEYTVVLLDGKEQRDLSLEQVKQLFFGRQINQNSLVRSRTDPNWRMLKREFDLSQWLPEAVRKATYVASAPQPANPQPSAGQDFEAASANTVNSLVNEPAPNGHRQNNQSQTFYQAESLPAAGKLQNIQSSYAPTSVRYLPGQTEGDPAIRPGLRPAAVFLIINAFLYVAVVIINGLATKGDSAESTGRMVGQTIIPVAIDLLLASKLWMNKDPESTRKWVLARCYVGFAIGLALPFVSKDTVGIVIGIVFAILGLFYLLAMALVLHGRSNPSAGRIYAGIGSFSVFALLAFGVLGVAGLGLALPSLAKLDLANSQIEKYKLEGRDFKDKTTGASVSLPDGWVMIAPSNPIVSTPMARMIAMDDRGERLAMLEVVPVPAQLDMKRQTPSAILDKLCDGVVASMQEQTDKGSIFGKPTVTEVSRVGTFVGKHPGKLLIVEKTEMGQRVKGHVTITYDELTFYVLHSWCPTAEYSNSQNDFQVFERSFYIPDEINSVFTQTAENDRRK
ncbi:MAG: hypothetical protein IPN69_10340 [Acidobacteria bacterium]|nr:hypothetical protein [Acidobacteriota bacterium]